MKITLQCSPYITTAHTTALFIKLNLLFNIIKII
jgi:hypothetical protein